jgi:hypothetical protein
MLQQAVDDAGPAEPGHHREPPRHCRGLEEADLLHPPDIQLQVRAPRGQRVQAAFGAPGQVAAQVGLGVLAGGTLETGQIGRHCQPQLISDLHQRIGRDGRQFGEVHHAQTRRPPPSPAKPANTPDAANECTRRRAEELARLLSGRFRPVMFQHRAR